MNKFFTLIFLLIPILAQSQDDVWKAKWIGLKENNSANTWTLFKHEVTIPSKRDKIIFAKIAADSKYWLWINEKLVVFEGGLKRGPNRNDTYYDRVDIGPYLKTGKNKIVALNWYFGKDGFSHKSSGKAGFLFDCQSKSFDILSNDTWQCGRYPSFGQSPLQPLPNYRLPESIVHFDARKAGFDDIKKGINYIADKTVDYGTPPTLPWSNLVERPIPQWKDFGLKSFKGIKLPFVSTGDTVILNLPYNAQITPYFKIDAQAGQDVSIFTDNYLTYNGGADYIRAEYITRTGIQEYESLGWVNGHKVYYVFPKGVKILDLKYRETGFNTEFSGDFTSSDPFLNKLWEKANRTLYLTMRDNFMDCPDRERAQWTGDAVIQSGESFYAYSTSSHSLSAKWLSEFFAWQKPNGVLYSPVPAGNWDNELADQSAATVGYFGLWNYYLHTGDKKLLSKSYDAAKKYLDIWEKDEAGLVKFRAGGWAWGDWGNEKDMLLIYNLWYYLGVKGMYLSAQELGKQDDALKYSSYMQDFEVKFNNKFWNGKAYRDPLYLGQTDDRVQALAVVSGIAKTEKYPALLEVLKTSYHASPYMEKYVFEAMFMMGYADEAMIRHKERFKDMVNDERFSTLFEGWGIGSKGFGGGTVNHSWSGGGLTVLSQYLCGIMPLTPKFLVFRVAPQPGKVKQASATVSSASGLIKTSFLNSESEFVLNVAVPQGTNAVVVLPVTNPKIVTINSKVVWKEGVFIEKGFAADQDLTKPSSLKFKVASGNWKFVAK